MKIDLRLLFIGVAIAWTGCATQPRNVCYPASPSQQLVGTWLGIDEEQKQGALTFLPDGTARLTVEETMQPSPSSPSKITYQVNSRTTPWELDLTITQRNGQKRVLRGLVELVDQNTMHVGFVEGFNAPRPKSFDEIPANRKQRLARVAQ